MWDTYTYKVVQFTSIICRVQWLMGEDHYIQREEIMRDHESSVQLRALTCTSLKSAENKYQGAFFSSETLFL